MDEEGYFYVVGRKKEMIKVGGERVSAKEIEEIIYTDPDIVEAAVIGVEDELLGEAIAAFVVLKPDIVIDPTELEKRIKQKLPAYMHPKTIDILTALPKNPSGKILKQQLLIQFKRKRE